MSTPLVRQLGLIFARKLQRTTGIPNWYHDRVAFMAEAFGSGVVIADFQRWCDEPETKNSTLDSYALLAEYFSPCEDRLRPVPEGTAGLSLGRPSKKLQQAIQWLELALQDGERHPVGDLVRAIQETADISAAMLGLAAHTISVQKTKTVKGAYWQLASKIEASEIFYDFTNEEVKP